MFDSSFFEMIANDASWERIRNAERQRQANALADAQSGTMISSVKGLPVLVWKRLQFARIKPA